MAKSTTQKLEEQKQAKNAERWDRARNVVNPPSDMSLQDWLRLQKDLGNIK